MKTFQERFFLAFGLSLRRRETVCSVWLPSDRRRLGPGLFCGEFVEQA